MGLSLDRFSKLMQKELSILLLRAKDENLSKVTVTEIRITNDLSFATVFYSVIALEKEAIEASLARAKGFLKTELAKKLKARKMPELIFKYDEALEYGNHISKILSDIKQ